MTRKSIFKTMSFLLILACTLPTAFGSLWDLLDKPRDCTFTHWGPWEACYAKSKGVYEHKRKRTMSQPTNGGKVCPTSPQLEQRTGCTKTEVLADEFLRQVHSESYSAVGTAAKCTQNCVARPPSPPLECREWRDAKNNIIMGGGSCTASKVPKRSPSSNFGSLVRRIRRQAPTTERNRDILFLLDESGSIGKDHFETVKRMAAAVTTSLCGNVIVKSTKTRISAASFDRINHPHFYLKNEHMNAGWNLADKIRNIKYNSQTDGSTCLGSALQFSRSNIFTNDRGARLNTQTDEQMVILITDGCANCKTQSLEAIARELYQDNISILALYIGEETNECRETLRKLSNDARCWEMFGLDDWSEATEFASLLESKSCLIGVWDGWGRSCY